MIHGTPADYYRIGPVSEPALARGWRIPGSEEPQEQIGALWRDHQVPKREHLIAAAVETRVNGEVAMGLSYWLYVECKKCRYEFVFKEISRPRPDDHLRPVSIHLVCPSCGFETVYLQSELHFGIGDSEG
jgi:hypothetical protein